MAAATTSWPAVAERVLEVDARVGDPPTQSRGVELDELKFGLCRNAVARHRCGVNRAASVDPTPAPRRGPRPAVPRVPLDATFGNSMFSASSTAVGGLGASRQFPIRQRPRQSSATLLDCDGVGLEANAAHAASTAVFRDGVARSRLFWLEVRVSRTTQNPCPPRTARWSNPAGSRERARSSWL